MVFYVWQLMLMNNVIILVGFLKYMMIEVRNLNYIYLGIMILIYLEVLQNFRIGLCVGDKDRIVLFKVVFVLLFYVRYYFNYQEIEMMEVV